MADQSQPPKQDVRQPNPDGDVERPPKEIQDPDERIEEPVKEEFPGADPPSFTRSDLPSKKPEVPSTGLPSDAPGG